MARLEVDPVLMSTGLVGAEAARIEAAVAGLPVPPLGQYTTPFTAAVMASIATELALLSGLSVAGVADAVATSTVYVTAEAENIGQLTT